MKILIRKSDNVVLYAQDDLQLDTEAHGNGWRDPQFNTGNAILDDATLPAGWTGAVWSYTGGVWAVADAVGYAAIEAEAQSRVVEARSTLIRQIDTDTDAIYRAVQGDRAMEYVLAESDAKSYKAAGYTGPVPDSVASWASAKTKSAIWAADDILTIATGWRQAQSSIRATRLACKEQARAANDVAPVAAQWAAFVAAIKTALGV